jgi:hypothetical protein
MQLLVYCLNDFYVYVTQQDVPHRDVIMQIAHVLMVSMGLIFKGLQGSIPITDCHTLYK